MNGSPDNMDGLYIQSLFIIFVLGAVIFRIVRALSKKTNYPPPVPRSERIVTSSLERPVHKPPIAAKKEETPVHASYYTEEPSLLVSPQKKRTKKPLKQMVISKEILVNPFIENQR